MKRPPVKWVLIGLAVAVVLGIGLAVFSTLQPDYYRRYPALAERMDNWKDSTHSKVSCGQCHIHPGIGGFVSFAAQAVPAFYSQLLSGPDTTNLLQAPARVACEKCHTTTRSVAPSGDLLIPHRAHVEVLGMECVTCHKDLVHSLNRRGFNRPEMELCLEQCHNGDKASNECADCHTRKNVPPSHAAADWLQAHGAAAAFEDCESCHSWTPDYCATCHQQRPASHVGNWKSGHGPAALARGEGCTVCHGGEEFCAQCH